MRVISGLARGHRLVSLDGTATRPTTDRVKESMFSMLHFYLPGARVLDLFGGSGALGIEALSRGADYCDFVEQNPRAAGMIRTNLAKTKLEGKAALHVADAFSYLNTCRCTYDIVLLDPPYQQQLCDRAMGLIYTKGLLAADGMILCETSAQEEIASPFAAAKQAVYGNTKLSIYRGEG